MGPGVSDYLPTRAFWNFAYVTLVDDDTNSILTDDANRAIWRWWLSFRLKLVFVIMVATIYVCCWAIGEVKSVIEMVLDEKDDRVVHKVEMVVTKEWRKVSYL